MKDAEHLEQKKLIQWFRLQYPRLRYCLFAIPNGGARHVAVAKKLKDEGVLAGVSDLFLMKASQSYHGLFIEMKSKKGKLSEAQKEFSANANIQGYLAVTCYGFDAAKKIITDYLHN